MTTGGVPDGMLSPDPKMRDMVNRRVANAHKPSTIACTLLLRRIGMPLDRGVKARGVEGFLAGSAMCMM